MVTNDEGFPPCAAGNGWWIMHRMDTGPMPPAEGTELKLACIPPLVSALGWLLVIEEVLIAGASEYLLEFGAIAVVLGTVSAIPGLVVAVRAVLAKRPSAPVLITGFALTGNLAALLFATWVALWVSG